MNEGWKTFLVGMLAFKQVLLSFQHVEQEKENQKYWERLTSLSEAVFFERLLVCFISLEAKRLYCAAFLLKQVLTS